MKHTEEEVAKLIEQATQKYPNGTEFRSAATGRIHIASGVLQTLKSLNRKYTNITDEVGGSVYYDGKWAEIISAPEVFVDIKRVKFHAMSDFIIAKDKWESVGAFILEHCIDPHDIEGVENDKMSLTEFENLPAWEG